MSLAASAFYMCRMGNYWDTEGKIFILEVPEECCLNIRGCLYTLRVKGKRGHIQSRLLFTWLLACRSWCLCQAPGKECFSNSSQKVCKGVFFSYRTFVWIYSPQNNHCSHLCHFQLILYAKANSATGCKYQVNLDST